MLAVVFEGDRYTFIRNDVEGFWVDKRNILVSKILHVQISDAARAAGVTEAFNFSFRTPSRSSHNEDGGDTVKTSSVRKVKGIRLKIRLKDTKLSEDKEERDSLHEAAVAQILGTNFKEKKLDYLD